MTATVDELRAQIAELEETVKKQRRQLGGVNAANRRKTQRIKDLERQLAARDEQTKRKDETR